MAKVQLSDVIVPEVFSDYVVESSTEKSVFVQSGIMQTDSEIDDLARNAKGGSAINMPFFKDLQNEDEVLSDTDELTTQKIESGKDYAILLMRGGAWKGNDLARELSGADPMRVIADKVVEWKLRKRQKAMIATLYGVFSATSMSDLVHDISAETSDGCIINAERVIDSTQLLGDAKDSLVAIAMHSAVESYLRKQDLIQYIKPSEGGKPIAYYNDKRVIVDDGLAPISGIYTTYLFGLGAIGFGNGEPDNPTEVDRNILAGDDILAHRYHEIMHPRGVKFTVTTMAGSSPTNAELSNPNNWERVYDPKNIRLVQFKHKLVANA